MTVAIERTMTVHGSDEPMARMVFTWCPGCEQMHPFRTWCSPDFQPQKHPTWEWNGSLERPTFTPSLLCYNSVRIGETTGNCHSFLTDGVWHFLSDSAHALAGQEVPMVDLPDWLL